MEKLMFLPTKLVAMVVCRRCENMAVSSKAFETEGGDYVCDGCITPDERQQLTLTLQEAGLAGQLGYLEAAEKRPDHEKIEETRGRLRSVRDKLRALWQRYCAPEIESGRAVVYGSAEHLAREAERKEAKK
jgi:hypothetical protein